MTENKRFTLAYEDYDWWAICDKENPTELGISGEEVVELLNELHEENKELKIENAQFDILIKNNQLAYIDLEKENEQLKGMIKEAYDSERTALGKSVLKNLVENLNIK